MMEMRPKEGGCYRSVSRVALSCWPHKKGRSSPGFSLGTIGDSGIRLSAEGQHHTQRSAVEGRPAVLPYGEAVAQLVMVLFRNGAALSSTESRIPTPHGGGLFEIGDGVAARLLPASGSSGIHNGGILAMILPAVPSSC